MPKLPGKDAIIQSDKVDEAQRKNKLELFYLETKLKSLDTESLTARHGVTKMSKQLHKTMVGVKRTTGTSIEGKPPRNAKDNTHLKSDYFRYRPTEKRLTKWKTTEKQLEKIMKRENQHLKDTSRSSLANLISVVSMIQDQDKEKENHETFHELSLRVTKMMKDRQSSTGSSFSSIDIDGYILESAPTQISLFQTPENIPAKSMDGKNRCRKESIKQWERTLFDSYSSSVTNTTHRTNSNSSPTESLIEHSTQDSSKRAMAKSPTSYSLRPHSSYSRSIKCQDKPVQQKKRPKSSMAKCNSTFKKDNGESKQVFHDETQIMQSRKSPHRLIIINSTDEVFDDEAAVHACYRNLLDDTNNEGSIDYSDSHSAQRDNGTTGGDLTSDKKLRNDNYIDQNYEIANSKKVKQNSETPSQKYNCDLNTSQSQKSITNFTQPKQTCESENIVINKIIDQTNISDQIKSSLSTTKTRPRWAKAVDSAFHNAKENKIQEANNTPGWGSLFKGMFTSKPKQLSFSQLAKLDDSDEEGDKDTKKPNLENMSQEHGVSRWKRDLMKEAPPLMRLNTKVQLSTSKAAMKRELDKMVDDNEDDVKTISLRRRTTLKAKMTSFVALLKWQSGKGIR
ncbi:unnamed protein product [Owenia fusiformis]|uniref:Uncharacterized protein n=1 Tax=Owenia fusiformis TaxID=6347 RepID=A0A8J1TDW4_OWEFU|nr:unnamed protein product [Owenia fusiformis]